MLRPKQAGSNVITNKLDSDKNSRTSKIGGEDRQPANTAPRRGIRETRDVALDNRCPAISSTSYGGETPS